MSDLSKLADDMATAAADPRHEFRQVVSKGALNIKNEARDIIEALRHHEPTYLPHYPRSITYDLDDLDDGSIEATIGPNAAMSQGELGNILEYGTIRSVPYPHLNPALDNESPRFEQNIADVAEKLLADR